ncbi:Hypothetical protein Tpal_2210 [Trichococcus palustris]|uniref:DUF1211 domain-containing protein n=2 Tax=Trichococcus palustris TaxID=140314 RepID=A0A143YT60_9LACT|nr:Hypothetical protein Tpal_2210 [Trichococcus palustris]SFL15306.1 Uncharacterized membrane protein [Trichococcus palustris]
MPYIMRQGVQSFVLKGIIAYNERKIMRPVVAIIAVSRSTTLERNTAMSKSRLEAFTDAIIAILMTIMVLGLSIPGGDTWAGLWAIRNKIFIYVISYFFLGIYWNNHHHMFQVADKINGKVMWLNTLFLFFLSLIPFATAWVGEHLSSFAPEMFYGTIVLLCDLSYALVSKQLIKVNGANSKIAKLLSDKKKTVYTLIINVLSLLLGFVNPIFVMIGVLLMLGLWIVPYSDVEREYMNSGSK